MSEGDDLIRIARILKANGIEGDLLVSLYDISPEDIDSQEPLFIYDDGLPVPFFIEHKTGKGNDKCILHLSGVDSLKDAEEIAGKYLYGADGSYEAAPDEDLSYLTGWTLHDESGKNIGTISDFEDIPGNPCLYIDTPNGQAMIPLHEELILSVDDENKILSMKIPDGLL